jgi:hypothetical protein
MRNKSILCYLGIHKWLYYLPDWTGDGHTIRASKSLEGKYNPLSKDTWLQSGVIRVCTRGCGKRQAYQDSLASPIWR